MKSIINWKFLYARYNDRFEYINNIKTTINNKRERERDRETDRERWRDREREGERQSGNEMEIQNKRDSQIETIYWG